MACTRGVQPLSPALMEAEAAHIARPAPRSHLDALVLLHLLIQGLKQALHQLPGGINLGPEGTGSVAHDPGLLSVATPRDESV